MEPTIGYPSSPSVLLRFNNIGLFCVQESPTDRPTMLDEVSMISNEHAPLPHPSNQHLPWAGTWTQIHQKIA